MKLKITQTKSTIACLKDQIAKHMVKVEEIED